MKPGRFRHCPMQGNIVQKSYFLIRGAVFCSKKNFFLLFLISCACLFIGINTQDLAAISVDLRWMKGSAQNWKDVKEHLEQKSIANPNTVTKLSLIARNLKKTPDWVFTKMPNLRSLNLSHNNLKQIPENLEALCKLEELDITHNCVSKLPISVGKLHALETVRASFNCLTTVPKALWHLPRLKELTLYGNQIDSITHDIQYAKNLETVVLGGNNISHISHNIMCPQSLRHLYLNNNSLRALPANIGCLRLKTLVLSDNPIETLPATIRHLKNHIQALHVQNCPHLLQENQESAVGLQTLCEIFDHQIWL